MIIICSCASIFSTNFIPSGPQMRDDGHRRNEDHRCFKSSPFWYDYRSLSLCQSTCISQGTIYPLGWAVVWMVSASFLFLRTNRVIIPSRGKDEAIKHARKGGFFLMCFVVSDAITVPIMWCFIFQSPWILPSLSLSLSYTHTCSMSAKKGNKNKQRPKCHVQF